ncbi:MAG: hypothetical protein KDD70_16870, partial [Bdellovibrionales bacterium]|nr:hypothetical protein [Bdellovibrionales bacterium]
LEKIHSIQVESYKKKEQELLYPVLDNSGVYASGINLQAYPTPGDPTPLLKSGLTPYELTTRYRFIQDQIEERKDFTYVERARIYIQDLGSYPLLCDGDFKFLPGPFGCGDFQFLFDLSGFLGKLNKFGRVKSVNGLAIEANRDVIDKLASMSVADEERSDASTLFLERFYPSVDNNGGIPHAI